MVVMLCRFEKVSIGKLHSQAKILGTIVTVGGAMILTLIKGPVVEFFWTKGEMGHLAATAGTAGSGHSELLKGAVLIITGLFCYSSFVILQVRIF